MPSFKKTATGWKVDVYVKGERRAGRFTTKAEAQAWAAQIETELRQLKGGGIIQGKTVRNAFEKYELEVSRSKRGHRWEALRLNALAEVKVDGKLFGDYVLADLDASHVAMLRDARLKTKTKLGDLVQTSTVNRELNLVSHVFSTARREWKWMAENITKEVRRPKNPESRSRRPTDDEILRLSVSLGFDESPATTKSQVVAIAFLFGIETAMRLGEIVSLVPENIKGRVAHLPMTKNGTKRDVPLSKRAIELISFLPEAEKGEQVFPISKASLDAMFRRATARCSIVDLHFHDSRHEAITRLSKKLDVLALAKMVGHRDLKQLQTYYNETAEELAGRLD